jgi:hypothetical protein
VRFSFMVKEYRTNVLLSRENFMMKLKKHSAKAD